MPSPNLAVAHVAASQNQKEVTINDAFDALDNAVNRALQVAMADANLTLTTSQANRHGLVVLTGSLTATREVTLPANHRRLALRNATTGDQAVTVRYPGSGAVVAVAPDSTALLVGDGTNLYGVAGGGTGGGAETLAGLDDVDVAGALNGDLLRFDGTLWGPVGSGVLQRAMLPFKGALVRRTNNLTSVSPPISVPWQAVTYDSDGFWDAGNPARLTVPAGVTKVRLAGSLALLASSIAGGVFLSFEKNGAGDIPGAAAATFRQGSTGYTNNDFATFTAVLPVTAGDWFQLRVNFTSPSWNAILANSRSWLALEVVETEDAADPPADITAFKPGQPGSSELLIRVPIVRRTRLAVDLAGSQGSAGTAATAETDFDLQRNGTSLATMRFAAAAGTASFIAAAETVLEPGDVLSVVAAATPDVTLADIGFTIAGTLVA